MVSEMREKWPVARRCFVVFAVGKLASFFGCEIDIFISGLAVSASLRLES